MHRGFPHYRQFKANTHNDFLLFLRLLPTHGYHEYGSHTLSQHADRKTDDRQTDRGKYIPLPVEKGRYHSSDLWTRVRAIEK